MIKNYNFNISEEEKRQILNLHESRTKRHYLINEQDQYYPGTTTIKLFDKSGNLIPLETIESQSQTKTSVAPVSNKIGQTKTSFSNYVMQAQKLLGVTVDGKFGPNTLKALTDKLGVLTSAQEKTPETPKMPETPKTPGTPETPKTPGTPGTTETPKTPKTPETPGTPAVGTKGEEDDDLNPGSSYS